jgi:tripartite-type tricarboxylate transporter receptor subunit TctC
MTFCRGAAFAVIATIAWCASAGRPAVAQDVASFYTGKRIQLAIGFDAGGGYDVYARLVARHMGRHIPGNPTIVPQNMAGAGSRLAANWLYAIAPKDGTAMGMIGQGLALDQALQEPGVRFDARRFNWIGNPIIDNLSTVVASKSGVKSLDDMKTREVFCGDVGAGPTSTFPEILNRLIGTRNKIVAGYPGVNAIYLAMERGEVACIGGTTWSSMKSTRKQKMLDKELIVLLQWGVSKDPEISQYAGYDVPLILDIGKTDLDREALNFIAASATMGRPIAAPPDVPADRVQALRHAFDVTMTDPEFVAEATKAAMDIKPLAGEPLQALAISVVQTPPAGVARAKELIGKAGVK